MSLEKKIPEFDHTKPCVTGVAHNRRYLVQGDNEFSYGEWVKNKQRYVPEPVYIPKGEMSVDELQALHTKVLFKVTDLMELLTKFQQASMDNLDKIYGKAKAHGK